MEYELKCFRTYREVVWRKISCLFPVHFILRTFTTNVTSGISSLPTFTTNSEVVGVNIAKPVSKLDSKSEVVIGKYIYMLYGVLIYGDFIKIKMEFKWNLNGNEFHEKVSR